MQRGGRQGDWEVFGEGLHRWQGEAETAKAGGILLQFCTLAKINLIYTFLGLKMNQLFLANIQFSKPPPRLGRAMHWSVETLAQGRIASGTERLSAMEIWWKTSSDGGFA